jgi:hypothetical protein
MSLVSNSNWGVGQVIDGLFSAGVTLYLGRKALDGLFKISVVFSRAVNGGLKMASFDPSRSGTLANKIAAWVPESVAEFFSVENGYSEGMQKTIQVSEVKDNGEVVIKPKVIQVPSYSSGYLLASGLALSLFALLALEVKHAFWRPQHPALNALLTRISPFRVIVGDTWISEGIKNLFGRAVQATNS